MAKNEHQQKLAQSGYRLPDTMYVEAPNGGASAEQQSGDGGQASSRIDASASEHGYQGALKTQVEVQAEADQRRTVDPETGLTIPNAVRDQIAEERGQAIEDEESEEEGEEDESGQKSEAGPSENKAARKATAKKGARKGGGR